jgi:DNA invertase Pin-like site-specific DNA recombinase
VTGRPPDSGYTYLRRSTSKQEASAKNQLIWALDEAHRLRVQLDATLEDLEHMLARKLTYYKAIFLDDGVTGADLLRPGFVQFRKQALAHRNVSHLFIHMPDRFARPERATEAVLLETELLYAGITVVFSTRVSLPRRRGGNYVAEDVQLVCSYSESGEYLNKLALRVLESQVQLAKKGYWTGGRPPYGFVRVRVDADGTLTEMADRTSIRRPGSHTEIRPKDPAKIQVWAMMLHWCGHKGWGTKRIAAELNDLKIPSPDSGRMRTEDGRTHLVSGQWTPSTVRALLNNSAIAALKQYGVQSEGKHRRLGPDGRPRLLEEADEANGTPRVVNNSADIVIRAPMSGFHPPASADLFEGAQAVLRERGKSQRGIAKTRDPGRYPLSTRVYDLDCGYPMWARTSGERRVYTCGRYINSSGRECEHNNVDAEALVLFVLRVLRQRITRTGGRERLSQRLQELSRIQQLAAPAVVESERALMDARLADLREELELRTRNLGRAKDDAEYDAMSGQFRRVKEEIERVSARLATLCTAAAAEVGDADAEVAKALALYGELEQLTADEAAREAIRTMATRLNLNLWLSFSAGKKGKRDVRVLTAGMLTTGNDSYPVRPYGDRGVHPDEDRRVCGGGDPGLLPGVAGVNETPSARPFDPAEDVSLCKAHRGDKI